MHDDLTALMETIRVAEADVEADGNPEERQIWANRVRPRILELPGLSRAQLLELLSDLDRLGALRAARMEGRAARAVEQEAAALVGAT